MRQAIFIMLWFLCGQVCCAQTITAEDKAQFEDRVRMKIDNFLSYLSQIGSKQVSSEHKDVAVKGALDLFIGKGHKYIYEDDYGNQKEHTPVTMQTTNKRGHVYPPKPMTTYLNNLRRLGYYKKLHVEHVDAIRIDELTPIKDNYYRAVAYFNQRFTGVTGDGYEYHDYSQSKIVVYLTADEVIKDIPTLDRVVRIVEIAHLGDITAIEK